MKTISNFKTMIDQIQNWAFLKSKNFPLAVVAGMFILFILYIVNNTKINRLQKGIVGNINTEEVAEKSSEVPSAKQIEPFASDDDTEKFLSKMDDPNVIKESEDITVSP